MQSRQPEKVSRSVSRSIRIQRRAMLKSDFTNLNRSPLFKDKRVCNDADSKIDNPRSNTMHNTKFIWQCHFGKVLFLVASTKPLRLCPPILNVKRFILDMFSQNTPQFLGRSLSSWWWFLFFLKPYCRSNRTIIYAFLVCRFSVLKNGARLR